MSIMAKQESLDTIILGIGEDEAIDDFLSAQKKEIQYTYGYFLKIFLEWVKMNGKQVLESKRQDKNYTWEHKLFDFRDWLLAKDYSEDYVKTAIACVKGFFAHHHEPLKLRRIENKELHDASREIEDHVFDCEDLARMAVVGNSYVKSLDRFQPKGETWQSRALKGNVLQAVLDPADCSGRKNGFIDILHKAALSNYFPLQGKGQVLDFGTGTGRFALWLSKRVSSIVGIDITREMLNRAKKQCPSKNVEFLLYDGTSSLFENEAFDTILSVCVLQSFNDNDLRNATKQLVRQLKKGGKIFLIEQVSYSHRLPEDYVEKFVGCKCLIQKPIRNSRSILQRIILRTKFIPKAIFPLIAKLELFWAQKESIPVEGYMDYLFIFEKC